MQLERLRQFAALVVVVGTATIANAQSSTDHEGLTIEVGLGVGVSHVSGRFDFDSPTANQVAGTHVGPAIAVSLGGWLTPQLALLGRVTSIDYTSSPFDGRYSDSVIGVNVEYVVLPRLWIAGGVGVAFFDASRDNGTDPNSFAFDTRRGYGLDARAGFDLYQIGNHALSVSLEVVPAFYNGARSQTTMLELGWHYLGWLSQRR